MVAPTPHAEEGRRGQSTAQGRLQVVVQLGYLPKVARSTWWLRLLYKVFRLCCEGGVRARGVRWDAVE